MKVDERRKPVNDGERFIDLKRQVVVELRPRDRRFGIDPRENPHGGCNERSTGEDELCLGRAAQSQQFRS
jgi:hypothetical protein